MVEAHNLIIWIARYILRLYLYIRGLICWARACPGEKVWKLLFVLLLSGYFEFVSASVLRDVGAVAADAASKRYVGGPAVAG